MLLYSYIVIGNSWVFVDQHCALQREVADHWRHDPVGPILALGHCRVHAVATAADQLHPWAIDQAVQPSNPRCRIVSIRGEANSKLTLGKPMWLRPWR